MICLAGFSIGRYLCSTIGKKTLVGITGLLLSGFVLTHMLGNMLILVGAEAYNKYAHALVSNPLLPVAEIGLVVFFLIHICLAISVTLTNRKSRKLGYSQSAEGAKATAFAAKSMILTGLLMLAFLVLHLITFKYGAHYSIAYNAVEMRDLYRLVLEKFQEPIYFGWYVFSMVVLALHLSHGFKASFQSLGLLSSLNPKLKSVGIAFAVIVAGGFVSQPIYIFLFGGK